LVAAELERRWEEALRACQEAEARLGKTMTQVTPRSIPRSRSSVGPRPAAERSENAHIQGQ
jgi:hypothetical protein